MAGTSSTEWSSVAAASQQLITPRSVESLIRGLARICIGSEVHRRVLSRALDGREGESFELAVRFQQFNTTGGYHLGYAANVEGGECLADRVTFVSLDKVVTEESGNDLLAQETIHLVLSRAACRDYGLLIVEKRQSVKVVVVSLLSGLSYGKRSHVGSMILADFLMSRELCHLDVFIIIREQAAANYFSRMGNLTQVSKVMVVNHHYVEWERRHAKAVGTLLFATYYVGFLIKGGRRGNRNLLEVLRMSFPGSLFDISKSHKLPLPHINTMEKICPPNLKWTMSVGDEVVEMSPIMQQPEVKKIKDCLRRYYDYGFVRVVTAVE